MAGQTANKPYKVLRIDELTRLSTVGAGVEKYYRHKIRTRGGTVLTVDIDADDFTPDKAGPILAEKAANADKMLEL